MSFTSGKRRLDALLDPVGELVRLAHRHAAGDAADEVDEDVVLGPAGADALAAATPSSEVTTSATPSGR